MLLFHSFSWFYNRLRLAVVWTVISAVIWSMLSARPYTLYTFEMIIVNDPVYIETINFNIT